MENPGKMAAMLEALFLDLPKLPHKKKNKTEQTDGKPKLIDNIYSKPKSQSSLQLQV